MRMRGIFRTVASVGLVAELACSSAVRLPPKAIALNREGAEALATGDLELAEAREALALEYNPRFTEAWVNLGLVELRRGNFERARRDFVKARDLNPDLPAPHHALGLLASASGRPDEAEDRYRAALAVDPGFAAARVNLGRLLFERREFEESREQFLRLTQVAPEVIEGWTGLCESLLRLDRLEEAQSVTARARELFGAVPAIDLLDARVLVLRQDFSTAVVRLRPLTLAPDVHQAGAADAWLAVALLGEGAITAASEAAQRARSLDPEDGVARYAFEATRAAFASDDPHAKVGNEKR